MEPSPLTQQERPAIFVQKVVGLYEDLFKVFESYHMRMLIYILMLK
jgi:hypothetical protein